MGQEPSLNFAMQTKYVNHVLWLMTYLFFVAPDLNVWAILFNPANKVAVWSVYAA